VTSVWIGSRSWPVLREVPRIGDLSYGIYIYAWPVQQVVVSFMGPASNYFALLAATLGCLIPIALVSWRFVERPALRRRPGRAEFRVNADSVYN
jgi:peptidoglycan/LPS O-acetylase OafA/YrhL